MRLALASLLFAFTAFAQPFTNATVRHADASAGVAKTIGNSTGWFAWTVPSTAKGRVCCWGGGGYHTGKNNGCCGCSLGESSGWGTNDDEPGTGEIVIAFRITADDIKPLQMFDTRCSINGRGKEVTWLTNVDPASSVAFFASHKEMAPIAQHSHPSAITKLISFARNDPSTKVRREAIFWLGQAAGEKAAGELRRAVDEDPEDDVREHAVFAISQLPRERSVPMLVDLVRNHKSRGVKKKAMFWLAQTGDDRALDLIEEILLPVH